MRIPTLVILTTITILSAGPTLAQTYSPDYPVCLQVYGPKGDYIECAYTSLAQCAMSASGRAVHDQSVLCECASATRTTLSAASSCLLA
jgi:hypothetical protein